VDHPFDFTQLFIVTEHSWLVFHNYLLRDCQTFNYCNSGVYWLFSVSTDLCCWDVNLPVGTTALFHILPYPCL